MASKDGERRDAATDALASRCVLVNFEMYRCLCLDVWGDFMFHFNFLGSPMAGAGARDAGNVDDGLSTFIQTPTETAFADVPVSCLSSVGGKFACQISTSLSP